MHGTLLPAHPFDTAGRLVIPKALRDAVGIVPGGTVEATLSRSLDAASRPARWLLKIPRLPSSRKYFDAVCRVTLHPSTTEAMRP